MTRRPPRLVPLLAALAVAGLCTPAAAHPDGNDAVDHFSVLSIFPTGLRVGHLFYLAENPTGALSKEIDADKNGELTQAEMDDWAKKKGGEFAKRFKLTLDGKDLKLEYSKHRVRLDPSPTSGLPELSVFYFFTAKFDPAAVKEPAVLVFSDENLREWRGRYKIWHDAGEGVEILQARKADKFDRSKNPFAEYTAKPGRFDDDEAAIRFRAAPKKEEPKKEEKKSGFRRVIGPWSFVLCRSGALGGVPGPWSLVLGGDRRAAPPARSQGTRDKGRRTMFAPLRRSAAPSDNPQSAIRNPQSPDDIPDDPGLMDQATGTQVRAARAEQAEARDPLARIMLDARRGGSALLWGLLGAALLGVLHARAPGHGKTMVAAYLIGEQGRWHHAVILGVIVTITHTAAVYLLVAAHIALSNSPGLRAALGLGTDAALVLSYWLGFAAALAIVFFGAYLTVTRIRRCGIAVPDHGHEHGHEHGHARAIPSPLEGGVSRPAGQGRGVSGGTGIPACHPTQTGMSAPPGTPHPETLGSGNREFRPSPSKGEGEASHSHSHAHAHEHSHSHLHVSPSPPEGEGQGRGVSSPARPVAAPNANVCPRCGQENGATAGQCARCGRALREPPYAGAFSHRIPQREPDEPGGNPPLQPETENRKPETAQAADHWADHGHSHAPPAGWKLSAWSLIVLGVTGGMLPCPSALLTALGAISTETRIGADMADGLPAGVVALLLVVAFSVGLAGALTAVGLVVVAGKSFARRLLADRASRASRWATFYLPTASAMAVTLIGSLLSIDLFCRATARASPLDALFTWGGTG